MMNRFTRAWKRTATLVTATLVAVTTVTSVGLVTAANAADCNDSVYWQSGYNDLHNNAFKDDYTSQRNGPYTACGQVNYAHRWTDIRLHCAGINDNNVVWAHIRNTNYSSNGWVLGSSMTTAVQNARVFVC